MSDIEDKKKTEVEIPAGGMVVGRTSITVVGLAPKERLQNISGDNWPEKPCGREYVTYTYIEEPSTCTAVNTASTYSATLRTREVYKDCDK